jgi:hypothetical protein
VISEYLSFAEPAPSLTTWHISTPYILYSARIAMTLPAPALSSLRARHVECKLPTRQSSLNAHKRPDSDAPRNFPPAHRVYPAPELGDDAGIEKYRSSIRKLLAGSTVLNQTLPWTNSGRSIAMTKFQRHILPAIWMN